MVLLWRGIAPHGKADAENAYRGLRKLTADDPSLVVKTAADGVIMLGASSEDQLEATVDVLVHGFRVEAAVKPIEVAYKEALTAAAEGEAKYVARLDGRNQYAHVKLRVEPGETGSGFVFVNAVAGGAIPERMIPSVDEGIREGLDDGVVAGYPVEDIRVTVYDGSYHDVDSSETAFRIAGALALQEAARKARPILLEPIMSVSIVMPSEYEHRINDWLREREAGYQSFRETIDGGDTMTFSTLMPLSHLLGYRADLYGWTDRFCTARIAFSHYGPAIQTEDGGDRDAEVTSPLRPRTPLRTLRASVPEPKDDLS